MNLPAPTYAHNHVWGCLFDHEHEQERFRPRIVAQASSPWHNPPLFLPPVTRHSHFFPKMSAANDLRKGMAIKYNGNTAIVLEVHHRTPGNLRAFVQAIIRYINTGKSADVRFGSTDKVELVDIERKQLEFSYKDRDGYHFMDPNTYETITLDEQLLSDAKDYLVENLPVEVLFTEG